MKVIILKDSPKIGRKDEVKDIPDGYVQNFLIPKGIVERATPTALKLLEERKSRIKVEKEINEKLLKENMEALKGITLEISEKANEKGHLFQGITKERLQNDLESKNKVRVDADMIQLDHPIKKITPMFGVIFLFILH